MPGNPWQVRSMSTAPDPFKLSRFLEAQAGSYDIALAELRDGHKQSHWIWYVFPQLAGLGRSSMAGRFGLSGIAEAAAYIAPPVMAARLRDSVQPMFQHGAGERTRSESSNQCASGE